MSEHAVFSPSGAKKWMTCPGSIAMEAGEPNEGSQYSDEGTAAHALAAMCLSENAHPSAYLGRVLVVVNGVYVSNPRPVKANSWREFAIDADMARYVNTYVQSVKAYAEGHDLQVEQRVPVGHITSEEGAEGTADAIVLRSGGDELQVHDLKYGMGVQVFAKENPQGALYLLGALEANRANFDMLGEMPSKFRFVIHQPRLDHLDEWVWTYDELMAFKAKAVKAAAYAQTALENKADWINIEDPPVLVPGEHCKSAFCRARATCPALANLVQHEVGAQFEVLNLGDVVKLVPTDLRSLGAKFAVLDIIADWVKQVRAKAEAALFEHNNSVEAQTLLGLKIVQGKKGNRQWDDAATVEALLKKMRYKTEVIYDLSVKTPPALEKLIADKPKHWAKLQEHIKQNEGQPSVAPLSDKRPALDLAPKADAFDVTDGSDLV